MEPTTTDSREQLHDAWDAVPRDGPAIFIAACEGDRPLYGTWVRLDQPQPYLRDELALLLTDDDVQHDWVVFDQVRLGDTMMPERLSVAGLCRRLQAGAGAGS